MDVATLLIALLTMTGASLVIMVACESFDLASSHLGTHVYKMPAGVRGATIDAIGSSMPELFTTAFLLFFYTDLDGFSAGIATCAGSAVFNAVIIPALCILVVTYRGVIKNGVRVKLPFISLKRSTLMRDAIFFLIAEGTLIVFLDDKEVGLKMGLALLCVYVLYALFLLNEIKGQRGKDNGDTPEEPEPLADNGRGILSKIVHLDFNGLIFGGRPFTATSAWIVLLLAMLTVGIACHFLADAVMDSAEALNIAPYFAAIILGAAATSVPDTVISVKAAAAGDYDDAVANAMGSNIFDICVALGLPLLMYSLYHGGVSVPLSSDEGSANVQELRVALIMLTVLVIGIFLYDLGPGKRIQGRVRVGKIKAFLLLAFYVSWTGFIVARSAGWLA